MKKKVIIILALICFSCAIQKESDIIYDLKCIVNDSNNNLFASFSSVGVFRKSNYLVNKDSTIIIKTYDQFDYFYDLYKNKFLIISIKKKGFTGWSGIYDIDKDSTYLYDLENNKKSYISLGKTYFVRNKNELKQIYNKEIIIDDMKYQYFAIDSINLMKNELFLVQPDLSINKCDLKLIN